jgi:predicted DNA-binding protein with PD1-like motif
MEFGDDPKDVAVFYEMEGPVELGVAQGYFGTDKDGLVVMHIHGLIMDKDGNMRCGNLVPGSAPILATVEMSIQEMVDIELVPTYDEVFKHKFLHPTGSEGRP